MAHYISQLNGSADSIQSTRNWIMYHQDNHSIAIALTLNEKMREAAGFNNKLFILYLIHDVLFASVSGVMRLALEPLIPSIINDIMRAVTAEQEAAAVDNILAIWGDRIFHPSTVDLINGARNRPHDPVYYPTPPELLLRSAAVSPPMPAPMVPMHPSYGSHNSVSPLVPMHPSYGSHNSAPHYQHQQQQQQYQQMPVMPHHPHNLPRPPLGVPQGAPLPPVMPVPTMPLPPQGILPKQNVFNVDEYIQKYSKNPAAMPVGAMATIIKASITAGMNRYVPVNLSSLPPTATFSPSAATFDASSVANSYYESFENDADREKERDDDRYKERGSSRRGRDRSSEGERERERRVRSRSTERGERERGRDREEGAFTGIGFTYRD